MSVTVVGVGEALFDVFEDGSERLGGAPLNFTVHAAQLLGNRGGGESCAMVSRVGQDEKGRRVVQELASRGVVTRYIQSDADHLTGIARVFSKPRENGDEFEIVRDAAWDFLEPAVELDELAASCKVLCFGTLGCRREANREAIEGMVSRATKAIRLFDVNLRQEYYDISVLRRGCAMATALKINQRELAVLADLLKLRGNRDGDYMLALFDRFPLEQIMLTRGEQGCVIYAGTARFEGAKPVSYPDSPEGKDAVGAGDAAAAAFAVGLYTGMPLGDVLELANRTGAWVASRKGGTPELPEEIRALVPVATTAA
ncbi:fructokinase [Bryobacterales bacterium F-183]|nr:fructokinase [Bryobacterales bacterium F-183]